MLTELFKTKERVGILSYILYQKNFTVNQVSRETGVTKGLVSRYLRYLHETGLVSKTGKLYSPSDCAHTRAIKLLINLNRISMDKLNLEWATGIGLFGSWAQGTNSSESDLDIWVRVDMYPTEYQLAYLQGDMREMTHAEVNLLVLTPEKLLSIQESDLPFYNSLLRTSVILSGDLID
jgi:predicted nucleotidyltransferase